MRKPLAVLLVATGLAVGACSGSSEPADTSSAAESSAEASSAGEQDSPAQAPSHAASHPTSPAGHADLEVTIEGAEIAPNGERLDARVGEPVLLAVTSDRETELHVHSTPEQEIEVAPGSSTVPVTVDNPGLVDVEEHETGIVIAQLEVR